jgi:dolichol-phosphate mannosyltransferase
MRVKIGKPSKRSDGSNGSHDSKTRHLFFKEVFGAFGFATEIEIGERINVIASPILRYSPHVLYTNIVEPVLRWAFVERGYALVHGATLAYGDQAYMITARTDTGKTTTLLKILEHQRRYTDMAAFISDDMTIVAPDGTVYTYPKPMTISYHTVHAVNSAMLTRKEHLALLFQSRLHSRSGRKAAFAMGKTPLPMATINTIVQLLVPPPKYPVQRLVPRAKMTRTAKLSGLFIIERGEEFDTPIENQKAVEILLENCEDAYGFPPYNSIKEFLYTSNGQDLRPIEQSIIRNATSKLPATLIRSKCLEWWRRIPVFVDDVMASDFADRSELSFDEMDASAIRI